ncbi:hypothetical protein B6U66_04490 [Candidatus Bathyarchaeota archaeon ex4484_135]|nr:MAG: hypothetical protein B6U66_04490 [Candidatus Bathyarchaeota archaeon ex4484_135]
MSKVKTRLLRYWTYFRRGHNIYLVFLLSFANFIAIQYKLIIENMAILKDIFTHLSVFAAVFVLVYVPAAIIIGWLDYRRLAVPVDMTITAKASPWVKDLATALIYIAEGKGEEAKKVLEKWTKGL